MQVPAFCLQCKRPFPSGIEAENSSMSIDGCHSGPCPWCGHAWGEVPSGTFSFINGTMRILSASDYDRARLEHLAAIVEEGRRNHYEPDRIVRAIENEDPRLAAYLKGMGHPAALAAWITLLIEIIRLLLASNN